MLSNCSQCRLFDQKPNHEGDIRCANNPAYAEMWQRLKNLDEYTLRTIPVSSCFDFDQDKTLAEEEIEPGIEPEVQWRWVDSSGIEAIAHLASEPALLIKFHSQKIYKYANVSRVNYYFFLEDESKEEFFEIYIKGRYSSKLYMP